MSKKDDYIKIRVTKAQKELFKKVAGAKGITMTDLLVVGTEEKALRELNKIVGTKKLESRVIEVEDKLKELKDRMASRITKKKTKC